MANLEASAQHIQAAQMIADGELTDLQIAEKLDVARSTLWNWRQRPEFMALVDEHLARFHEEVCRRGLANRDRRIRALNDRWNRMQRVIEARADDVEFAEVPGGQTGLLAKSWKMIGSGPSAEKVSEFAVDTGLLRELREHEKQAAQELGQWVEKKDVEANFRASDADRDRSEFSSVLTALRGKGGDPTPSVDPRAGQPSGVCGDGEPGAMGPTAAPGDAQPETG